MTRPQTVQDVLDALRRDRLVEPARLSAFADRHAPPDAAAALARLVADGLLTAFQAEEVSVGNGPGLRLGGYRLLDRLGKGGMGSVFLAEHAVLGKRVAVKVLADALRADPLRASGSSARPAPPPRSTTRTSCPCSTRTWRTTRRTW